jgi:hypothetical protein
MNKNKEESMANDLPSSFNGPPTDKRASMHVVKAVAIGAAIGIGLRFWQAKIITLPLFAVTTVLTPGGVLLAAASVIGAYALYRLIRNKNGPAAKHWGKVIGFGAGATLAALLLAPHLAAPLTVGWLLKTAAPLIGLGTAAGTLFDLRNYLKAPHTYNMKTGAKVGAKIGAFIGLAFSVAATWMMAPIATMPLNLAWLIIPLAGFSLGITAGLGIGALVGGGIALAMRLRSRQATRPSRDLRYSKTFLGAGAQA